MPYHGSDPGCKGLANLLSTLVVRNGAQPHEFDFFHFKTALHQYNVASTIMLFAQSSKISSGLSWAEHGQISTVQLFGGWLLLQLLIDPGPGAFFLAYPNHREKEE